MYSIYFNLSFFLGGITPVLIGLMVYLRNKRRVVNKTFFFLSLCGAIWSFGLFLMLNSNTYELAYLWRLVMDLGSILLPAFWTHFVYSILGQSDKRKRELYFYYFISIVLIILNISDLFAPGVFIKEVAKKSIFNFYPTAGPGYYLFVFYYLTVIPYSLFNLFKDYKKRTGFKSQQIKYIIVAALLGFAGGGTAFLLTFDIFVLPYGIILFTIYPIIIAYAIVKYRFMDVRTVVLRSITFGVIISLITIIFAGVSGIVATLFQDLIGSKSNIISGLIVGILVSIGYQPLRRLIEYSTNRLLYKKRYDPDELLSKINSITSSILNLSQLLKSASEILVGTFHSSKFSVALLDKNNKLKLVYHEGFNGTIEKFTAGKEKILNLYFKDSRDIQVIDEMKARFEAGEYQPKNVELLSALYEMDIALIIPLFAKEELTGIIAVGNKKSGDPYNQQDLNIWKIISGQLAVAIENARLYDELKKFNINLQQKVDDATQELRNANRSLREMDQMKSDFISIASHQLRTPLTVIKGYISMIQEGSFGKVSPVITEQLGKVYQSNERLIGLVENLLDISRIESGRQEFDWISIDFSKLAATVVDNLKQNAKNKNIRLSFIKPKSPVPQVIADKKIHEVMMNFVDNAIKYTKAGKIEVSVAAQPAGMVTFSVKDTGRGVTKQGMEYLFKKFSRGKGSFQVHTEGLGLGLFVAKMLIDAHHGVIGVESAGVDKGAKFFFSIPLDGPKSKIKPSEPICRYLGE